MSRAAFDPKTEELTYIKGDKDPLAGEDPAASMYRAGQMRDHTGLLGHGSEVDFTHGASKIDLRYSGKYGNYVLKVDVYQPTPGTFEVHLHCPKCHEVSRITSERKSIEFDERQLLSVEKFQCCWEMPEGRRMEFGIGLCRASYAIDRNVLKDA
jgi:hypothetical protein